MIYLLLTIIGLLGIIKSADFFIDQSISLAKRLKISSFVIGFTIVAFGTSLPELIVGLYSAHTGHTAIAISNVIGSNIANICLILGLLAIYKPYKLSKSDVFYNIPLNLIAFLLFIFIAFINGGHITPISGILLIGVFILSLILSKNNNHEITIKSSVEFNPLVLFISLFALIFFGKLVVDNVLELSRVFGIAESLLGYFIVAVGTSLPELIASFAAIKKGNQEVGLGNILGSNMFNLLFIMGSSSIIRTLDLSSFVFEILLLGLITASLVIFAVIGKKYYFTKNEGLILLGFYLIFAARQFV